MQKHGAVPACVCERERYDMTVALEGGALPMHAGSAGH